MILHNILFGSFKSIQSSFLTAFVVLRTMDAALIGVWLVLRGFQLDLEKAFLPAPLEYFYITIPLHVDISLRNCLTLLLVLAEPSRKLIFLLLLRV